MFNVWCRSGTHCGFAQDYAPADIATRQCMICGIGRGTVPVRPSRWAPGRLEQRRGDAYNREVFEEQVRIIVGLVNETPFDGQHYALPPQRPTIVAEASRRSR